MMKTASHVITTDRHTLKNPFAGIIMCGECGHRMKWRSHRDDSHPDTLLCEIPGCPNVSAPLHLVETRVLEALEEWLSAYKLKWQFGEVSHTEKDTHNSRLILNKKALKRMTAEMRKLQIQKSMLPDLLAEGIYDTETFQRKTRELEERMQQTESYLAAVEADIHLEEMRDQSRRIFIAKAEHLLESYEALPDAQKKNNMLREVIEKIVCVKEKDGRWHDTTDGFALTLYPKLPKLKYSFRRE
jgi:hypothetical protein